MIKIRKPTNKISGYTRRRGFAISANSEWLLNTFADAGKPLKGIKNYKVWQDGKSC